MEAQRHLETTIHARGTIMAEFKPAFEKTMLSEGGYKLHKVKGDRGGQTFAGISRKFHPDWPGWELIDAGERESTRLTILVQEFFDRRFWDRINGEAIQEQTIADSIYDFAVNAGPVIAIKLAQMVVGVTPDGIVGPKTSTALNTTDPEGFQLKFAIAKVARYATICRKDRTQKKFLLGWINRTLEVLS